MEILRELDKQFLVKVVAKTPASTNHINEDGTVRVYSPVELQEAARSLAFRHIDVNHNMKRIIPDAFVVDAQFNDGDVECLCYIPSIEYIRKLKESIVKTVSIEEYNREDVKTAQGTELKGIIFTGLALVDPSIDPRVVAGDTATSLQMFETKGMLCEITKVESYIKTEPFAGYTDFADCVAKNSDKDNPEGYCSTIMRAVEGKTIEECKEIIGKIPFTLKKVESVADPNVKKPEEILAEKDKRISELETAVATATKATQDLKVEHDKKVAEAKQEGKKEVIDKIKEKIPPCFIENKFGMGAKRFTEEIKKVVREESGEK